MARNRSRFVTLMTVGCVFLIAALPAWFLLRQIPGKDPVGAAIGAAMGTFAVAACGLTLIFVAISEQRRRPVDKRLREIPDFLDRKHLVFDCNGLEFTIAPEVVRGDCTVVVAFQNRFEGEAECDLFVQIRGSVDRRLAIGCDGGAYGTARFTLGIPRQFHGKNMAVFLGGRNRYPNGRQAMLRPFAGTPLKPRIRRWETWLEVISSIATPIIAVRSPTQVFWQMPDFILNETMVDGAGPVDVRIHWRPGDDGEVEGLSAVPPGV